MGKGLLLVLRSIGVNITDEDAKMIEGIIPRIPSMIQQLWGAVDSNMKNFDNRLQILEKGKDELKATIEALREEIAKNGIATRP